jgi:hypothetical protein
VNHYYSWLEDYFARLDGKEARKEFYERYYGAWHETAQKLAEAILESHRMLSNYSVEAQERQTQITQSFFTSVDDILIPFRFIDGIMRACQRYTTHG